MVLSDLETAPGRQGGVPGPCCGTLIVPPPGVLEGKDTDLRGRDFTLPELTHRPQEVVLVVRLRLVAVELLDGGGGVRLPLDDLTGLARSTGAHRGGFAGCDVHRPGGVVVVRPGAGVTDTGGRGGLFSKPTARLLNSMSRLDPRYCWRQLSYAIKNQFGHPKNFFMA